MTRNREQLYALYPDLLDEQADPRLVRLVQDLDTLYTAAQPPEELALAEEQAPREHADLLGRTGVPMPPLPRPRWSDRWNRSGLVKVAGVVVLILGLGAALLASPEVRAQIARLAYYVPGFGIRNGEAPGLVASGPVSVSKDGNKVRVKNLLSADGETVIQMEVEIQAGIDFKFVSQQVRLTLRDDSGRVYQSKRLSEIGGGSPTSGDPFTAQFRRLNVEWTLDALAPGVRTVEVAVDAPAPLGAWSLPVPVVPMQQAGLPQARVVRSGLELHGITVGVSGVSASPAETVVQLRAQVDPQVGKLRSIGPSGLVRRLALRDDRGREYPEKVDLASQPPSLPRRSWSPGPDFTVLTEDLLFPPLAPDARSAEITVPFVVIGEESGEASFGVPIGGKKIGERIPLEANLTMGSYSFRVTYAEIVDGSGKQLPVPPGERRLVLQLDLGDWNGDRKLMGLGLLLGGAESRGFSPSTTETGFGFSFPPGPNEDPDGQWKQVALVLPPNVGDQVTVTFRSADVAVRGPWRLQVPVGTDR